MRGSPDAERRDVRDAASMDARWKELRKTKRRLASQIADLRTQTRELLADAVRVRDESKRTRSDAAELRVEVNHRRLSLGRRLEARTRGRPAGTSAGVLQRARPSEHPDAAEIIALHELHAEHERSAGRGESAERAQGRANRIRRLVERQHG